MMEIAPSLAAESSISRELKGYAQCPIWVGSALELGALSEPSKYPISGAAVTPKLAPGLGPLPRGQTDRWPLSERTGWPPQGFMPGALSAKGDCCGQVQGSEADYLGGIGRDDALQDVPNRFNRVADHKRLLAFQRNRGARRGRDPRSPSRVCKGLVSSATSRMRMNLKGSTMDGSEPSRRCFVLACGCVVSGLGGQVAFAHQDPLAAPATQARPAMPPAGPMVPPPPGWTYLPELGVKNIYSAVAAPPRGEPRPQIKVTTRRDVGILEKQVDVPLTPRTSLRWMWNVQRLPSQIAENVTAGHDYLSIAVRFDNGLDMTYMFSSTLPAGTHFHCPLRNWNARETHVILHSGTANLNKWLSEERTILPDYRQFVARGEEPKRITQVWLIANSSIQRTEGDASFAEISLGDGRRRLAVS